MSWHSNGECYKTYTPGPCRPDQFIVPSSRNSLQARGQGLCVRNPCPRAHLFFPGGGLQTSPSKRSYNGLVRRSGGFLQEQSAVDEEGDSRCYKVGSRGPCPLGQLVVFERYSGKVSRFYVNWIQNSDFLIHQIEYICPAYIYFYFRALRVNVDALKDTIKIIGQRLENVLNGTHKDHVPSLSSSCIIERRAKLNVFAMSKMVLYFGMKQDDATGCTLR